MFFEHFSEHRENNKNLSLLDYFTLHYFTGQPKHDDRDVQLPFQTSVECVLAVIPATVHRYVTYVHPPKILLIKKDYVLSNDNILPSEFGITIFQPPRV